eukprot:scaffold895_cov315-Pinguiococcus_pyrenoidosus.AAC.58
MVHARPPIASLAEPPELMQRAIGRATSRSARSPRHAIGGSGARAAVRRIPVLHRIRLLAPLTCAPFVLWCFGVGCAEFVARRLRARDGVSSGLSHHRQRGRGRALGGDERGPRCGGALGHAAHERR